jgi:hypothetical protein
MKKIILSALLFVMLISMSLEKAEAQCATGYTLTSVSVPYMGCTYSVQICFKCSVSSNGFDFNIVSISPADSACYRLLLDSLKPFLAYAKKFVFENYSHTLCTIPPCNQGLDGYAEVRTPMCWKMFNNNGVIDLVACSGAYCRESYSVCFNYTTMRTQRTWISTDLIGTIDCPTTKPPTPVVNGTYSTCWNPAGNTCP